MNYTEWDIYEALETLHAVLGKMPDDALAYECQLWVQDRLNRFHRPTFEQTVIDLMEEQRGR